MSKIKLPKEEKLMLISMLANDIRGNWAYYVEERLDLMIELCEDIEEKEAATFLRSKYHDIVEEGRTLRDDFKLYECEYEYDGLSEEAKELYGPHFTCDHYKELTGNKENQHIDKEESNHMLNMLNKVGIELQGTDEDKHNYVQTVLHGIHNANKNN